MMQLPEFLSELRHAESSIAVWDVITQADQQIGT
jgi:hypothetical protein